MRTVTLLAAWLAVCVGWWWVHPTTGPAAPTADQRGHRIDVNEADETALRLLPGVGPTLAERIVVERDAAGPFQGTADLRRVPGVGERVARTAEPWVAFGRFPSDQR